MRAVWVPYLSLDMTKEADKSYAAFRESLMTSLLRPKIAARTHWLYMCVLMETHTILPTIIRGRIS